MSFPDRINIDFHPFVKDSICRRLSDILQSVLDAGAVFPSEDSRAKVVSAVHAIKDLTWTIEGIDDTDGGPDWTLDAYKPYIGQTIIEVDWFFLENYAYRFLLKATGYFTNGKDPFASHKQKAIDNALPLVTARLKMVQSAQGRSSVYEQFRAQLILTLVGNRADLSLSAGKVLDEVSQAVEGLLLVDDIEQTFEVVQRATKVVVVLDNCGAELFEDLLMAHFMLTTFQELSVTLHCKSHPVFVSDAIESDVYRHIDLLSKGSDTHSFKDFIENGRLRIVSHPFYTTPFSFFDMPEDLRQTLFKCDLVITKGDANYRRLLGDGAWPYSTPFADVLSFWACPLVAVRTCKSPVIVGVSPCVQHKAKTDDSDWLVNGKYGLIQFKA